MPASERSDSVVEKEILGFRSTREVSNVVSIEGCVILRRFIDSKGNLR
jgi:hypothetical protein